VKITPLDIRRKEFKRSVRGYSDEEVDIFLDEVADEFERLFQENMELHDRMSRMEEQIAGHAQLKDALEKTLISAQLQAEEIRGNAHKESELILRDAEMKARGIVSDSYGETQKTQQTLVQLKLLEEDFRFKFRSLLEGYLRLLSQAPLATAESEPSPLQGAPAAKAEPSAAPSTPAVAAPAASAAPVGATPPRPQPASPAPFGQTAPSTAAPAMPAAAPPSAPSVSQAQTSAPVPGAPVAPMAPAVPRPLVPESPQVSSGSASQPAPARPITGPSYQPPEPPPVRPASPATPSEQPLVPPPGVPRPVEPSRSTLPLVDDDTPTEESSPGAAKTEPSPVRWPEPPARDLTSEVTQEAETAETRFAPEPSPQGAPDDEPMRRFFFGRKMNDVDDMFESDDAPKKDRNRDFEW
jgi:cell division initiation protein